MVVFQLPLFFLSSIVRKVSKNVSKGTIITNLETKIMHGLREDLVTVVLINRLKDGTQIII